MALKMQYEGRPSGSLRPTITIKASVETHWCTLQIDVTKANGGQGVGGVLAFQSSSPNCSVAPYTPSSKVHCPAGYSGVQEIERPGLCS